MIPLLTNARLLNPEALIETLGALTNSIDLPARNLWAERGARAVGVMA
ncbi:hypothetical protein [Albidovulum sp.]|nr:hypothetical protein [Defluviimonas sp.]